MKKGKADPHTFACFSLLATAPLII